MRSIDLLPNEGVIAQFDNVGCESPDFKGFERGELTLTNMSLVFTYTQIKMFGKDIDHTFSWALRDIKVVNGKPQLIVDKGESHQCDVLLRKGKIELRMGSHADLSKLVNGINKEITGSDEDVVGAPKTFISGIASMLTGATKEMAGGIHHERSDQAGWCEKSVEGMPRLRGGSAWYGRHVGHLRILRQNRTAVIQHRKLGSIGK